MKRLGHKYTKSLKGHQRCGICHPELKNGKKRSRRNQKKEIATQLSS